MRSFADSTLYFVIALPPQWHLVLHLTINETLQVTKAKASSSAAATATTTGALAFDYTRHDSLEAEIELRKSEPLPFSSKRSMFSTGKVAQVHFCIYMIYI